MDLEGQISECITALLPAFQVFPPGVFVRFSWVS